MAAKKKATTVKKKAVAKKKVVKKTASKKAVSKKATKKKAVSKKPQKIAVTMEQRHKMICEAAYYISLKKTHETVSPTEDWFQAEAAIDQICIVQE